MNLPRRQFLLINIAALLFYSMLYFLFSSEAKEGGFPVYWSVYFSVHGLGLLILSIVFRGLREPRKAGTAVLAGLIVLSLGWIMVLMVGLM